jgi:hypothetical protein
MPHDWSEITKMTGGKPVVIERVRIVETGVALEGEFILPPLAGLNAEDQLFLAAFVRSHGSIKQMEQLFGISYPTVKNRLNRIGDQLDFIDVKVERVGGDDDRSAERSGVLDQLERGEIDVEQAVELLNKGASHE